MYGLGLVLTERHADLHFLNDLFVFIQPKQGGLQIVPHLTINWVVDPELRLGATKRVHPSHPPERLRKVGLIFPKHLHQAMDQVPAILDRAVLWHSVHGVYGCEKVAG